LPLSLDLPARPEPLPIRQVASFGCLSALAGDADAVEHDGAPRGGFPRITEQYSLSDALGQGAHGVVYLAKNIKTGLRVALKIVRVVDEELVANVRREFELQSSLNHPHIVRALEYIQHSNGVAIAMETFDGQTLQVAIDKSPEHHLAHDTARSVFRPLLEALDYLHRRGIVHRDIKATNVLVSNEFDDLRLIDFSVAHRLVSDGEMLDMRGTPDYLAPETLLEQAVGSAGDVWGAGVCLHLMLFGRFEESAKFSSNRRYGRFLHKKFSSPNDIAAFRELAPACRTVLGRSLDPDPATRAAPVELLASDWLSEA